MSIVIKDINALNPKNQLLEIKNSMNELFNLLKDCDYINAVKKSEMKKSFLIFLKH